MIPSFQITKRHYDIILKQALDNYPTEIGGFLGGNNGFIMAVHPLFNFYLYNKTDTFIFNSTDLDRAHQFFQKHELEYYGLYHSHPKGSAFPSRADIYTGQKYHFILSLQSLKKPVFSAFFIKNGEPIQLPFSIIDLKGAKPVDIKAQIQKKNTYLTPDQESTELNLKMKQIKDNKAVKYPVLPPSDKFNSDFSTLA
jgi:proteasome lid subunit RPN8/RPN11